MSNNVVRFDMSGIRRCELRSLLIHEWVSKAFGTVQDVCACFKGLSEDMILDSHPRTEGLY